MRYHPGARSTTAIGVMNVSIVPANHSLVNHEGLKGGVYILRVGPRKYYFGFTVDFSRRRWEHASRIAHGRHENPVLQRSYDKHGRIEFQPIAFCCPGSAAKLEACLIQLCSSDCDCANLRLEDGTTYAFSEETRKRMSAASLGKPKSAEHARNIGAAKRGFKHSEQTKVKISAAKAGRPGKRHSAESRKKMSEAQRGRVPSEQARANMSKAQKGRRHSEATKEKIRQAAIAWRASRRKPK